MRTVPSVPTSPGTPTGQAEDLTHPLGTSPTISADSSKASDGLTGRAVVVYDGRPDSGLSPDRSTATAVT